MPRAAYLTANRLEDVIFLIQYIGLGQAASLTDGTTPHGVAPRSAGRWSEIARDHPEFFRLTEANTSILSPRHYLGVGGGNPPPLPAETVQTLVKNAMDLQERQAERVEVWKTWVTMLAAVVAAGTGITQLLLRK